MKLSVTKVAALAAFGVLLLVTAEEAEAQFRGFWLDIGEYHNVYSEGGARQEEAPGIPPGMAYPAILREAHHGWARGFWIGVKNWENERGQNFDTYVARIGPREPGIEFTSPVQTEIISRTEDTEVYVDDALAFDKLAVVDQVDPTIAADRMIINRFNLDVGVSVTRTIYAYVNQFHDNYHIIEYEYCNTGNIDADDEIELPDQTLEDVYFYHLHRWRSSGQASWTGSAGQAWGKFNMIDIVGDGHAEYPVDFTAFYAWFGYDPSVTQFNNLGAPLWTADPSWHATSDTVGRLSGASFVGRTFLHVDQSADDETYVRCTPATAANCQPHTLSWLDQDHPLAGVNESHENYYNQAILGTVHTGGPSRNFPHYADRVQNDGQFWRPTADASAGHGTAAQGGYAPTEAIGPYDLAFGDCIYQAMAEGVAALSYDAGVQIGRAYKRSGGNDDLLIEYDANKDGVIEAKAFDYNLIGLPQYQGNGCTACDSRGSESLTKNQWVMSVRDSMFQTFFRAHDLYEASNRFTQYPIPEAPYAPIEFRVFGRPDAIELEWTPHPAGGPPIDHWEIYRTIGFTDNLLNASGGQFDFDEDGNLVTGYQCIAGCPGTPDLSPGTTSFRDTQAQRGQDYFYYIIAVGQPQPDDPLAINGTPGGVPLKSSRYLTQTYLPATLKRPPYGQSSTATGTVQDSRIVPNPVNLGAQTSVRFQQEDRVLFYNIPPQCTIKIFTEIGELVHTIEHTNGSGDEAWNLTTDSRQLLVSGIYIAVIEDNSPGHEGETAIRKFTVIR